jgi:hypothetical protein
MFVIATMLACELEMRACELRAGMCEPRSLKLVANSYFKTTKYKNNK